MKKIPQDVVGSIAILKFKSWTPWFWRKFKAMLFLRNTPGVTTVVEKVEGFSGSLRVMKTKYLAGEKTKVTKYKENGCVFVFDVDETYFSSRLSHERRLMADELYDLLKSKNNAKVLFMFSGVGPFPVVVARKFKLAKKKVGIFANELNSHANNYAKKNIELNKLGDYITLLPGDAKTLPRRTKQKFDVVVMTRPQLDDTFLDSALKLSKKGAIIFYHGFGTKDSVLEEISRDAGKKIGKVSLRKAGDIGKKRFRWLAKFRVK